MYLHMLHQKSGSEVSCFRIRSNSRVLLSLPATVLAIQAQVSVLWIPWSDEGIRGKLQERVRVNNSASIKWAHAKKKKTPPYVGENSKAGAWEKCFLYQRHQIFQYQCMYVYPPLHKSRKLKGKKCTFPVDRCLLLPNDFTAFRHSHEQPAQHRGGGELKKKNRAFLKSKSQGSGFLNLFLFSGHPMTIRLWKRLSVCRRWWNWS